MRKQFNQVAYNNLSEAQSRYQEYTVYKHNLSALDSRIQSCNHICYQNPSLNSIEELKMYYEQKIAILKQQMEVLNMLKHNLFMAIQQSLMALQYSISHRDVINIMLDDSNVNSVISFVLIVTTERHIANSLRNYCQNSQILSIMSEIDFWKSSSLHKLNGYENLRKFIFDYSTM